MDDIEIQSETIPQGTLPLGRSFALTQTVVSRHSITRIEGRFADGDGDTLMSAAVLPGVHGGFDISGTAVDAALRFGSLAAGHYAYELKAIVTASSSLTSRTETFTEILVCPFSIELEPLRTYTVTFKDGMTREVLSQQNIYYGFSAVEPPLPVHNGYVFTVGRKTLIMFGVTFMSMQISACLTLSAMRTATARLSLRTR